MNPVLGRVGLTCLSGWWMSTGGSGLSLQIRLWKPSRRGRCSRTRAPRTSPPLCLKTSWHWASSLKPRSESSFTWRERGNHYLGILSFFHWCSTPLYSFLEPVLLFFSLVSPSVATDGIHQVEPLPFFPFQPTPAVALFSWAAVALLFFFFFSTVLNTAGSSSSRRQEAPS